MHLDILELVMWKNPKPLQLYMATANWGALMQIGQFDPSLPNVPSIASTDEALALMRKILTQLSAAFRETSRLADLGTRTVPKRFVSEHSRIMLAVARDIEASGDYHLIPEMAQILYDTASDNDSFSLGLMIGQLAKMIHILVGNETTWLAGTKNNTPAWRTFVHPIGKGSLLHLAGSPLLSVTLYLDYIDEQNARLVTDPLEMDMSLKTMSLMDSDSLRTYAYLHGYLKTALSEQRYLMSPGGVRVQFKDNPPFGAVQLSICSDDGEFASSYIVASFDTPSGSWFTVLDLATIASEELSQATANIAESAIISLYGQIITATEVPTGPPLLTRGDGELATGPMPDWWVTLPRVVDVAPFRTPIPSGRKVRDHTVHPFRRRLARGNITSKQLERVQAYCRSHSLPLPEIPRGFTFVLEHRRGVVPPTESAQE